MNTKDIFPFDFSPINARCLERENGDNYIDDLVDDRRNEKEQQHDDDAFVESLGDELRVLDVKVRSLSEENELCSQEHVLFGAFEEADDENERGSKGTGRRIF